MKSGNKIYLWLQMQNQRSAPELPMSHFQQFHHGKSPILPSSSPIQSPRSKSSVSSVPCQSSVHISLDPTSLVCSNLMLYSGPQSLLGPHDCYVENVQTNREYLLPDDRGKAALSLLGSGYIISGLEWTRYSLELINQLPQFSWALLGPPLNQSVP